MIECKRYAPDNKAGVVPVRAFYGVKTAAKATKAILATTSGFTTPAQHFLDANIWELEGRDHKGLLDWIKQAKKNK